MTYAYAPNSNRLASVTGVRNAGFAYSPLGAVTGLDESDPSASVTTAALYSPAGLLNFKEDFWDLGAGPRAGDTVAFFISPAGEMTAKINLSSGGLYWFYGYDLAGNLAEEGSAFYPHGDTEPVVDHIYLGNRQLASVTGAGPVWTGCFVATAAFGSPLAAELDTFRDLRDRILLRLTPGRAFVNWYYRGFGPTAAAWLGRHDSARPGAPCRPTGVAHAVSSPKLHG